MPIRVLEIGKKNFQRPYTDNREIWTQVRLDQKTHVLMPLGEQTNRKVEGITKNSKVKTLNIETGKFQINAKGIWPRSDTSFLTYNADRQYPEGEDGNEQDIDMSNQSMTISPSELPPLLSQESEEQENEESNNDVQEDVKPEKGEELCPARNWNSKKFSILLPATQVTLYWILYSPVLTCTVGLR